MKFPTKKRRQKIFNLCLVFILGIAFIILVKLGSDSDYRAAQLRFKRISAGLSNLDFVCTPDAGELKWFHPVSKMHLFSEPFRQPYPIKELRNVCKGLFKNKEIFVFDYKYGRPYSENGKSEYEQTVAAFRLPEKKFSDFFEKHREWAVEGVGEWIIIYQPDKRIDPDELQHFINQTSEIADVMQMERN